MANPQGMAMWERAFEEWKNSVNANSEGLPQFATVPSIDTPDLSAYKGYAAGNALFATDLTYYTIYAWATAGVLNSPYVVDGDGGYWVAISGRYINHAGRVNSLTASRVMQSDANKGLSSADLVDWVGAVLGRMVVITDGAGGVILDVDESGLDHNLMLNLTVGDVHTQYHNNTRGDARYYTQGQVDALVLAGIDSILCADGDVLVGDDGVLYGW